MIKTCRQCAQQFEIIPEDLAFYDKVSPAYAGQKILVPPPTLCPDCRTQRRLAIRNERALYRRECGLCKKQFVSVYSPDKPSTVYCSPCWYGDAWDPLDYGRDFDFSRPFFPQFQELLQKVPALGNMVFNSVNCEYNSYIVNSKDCYMSVRVGDSEKVIYSYLPLHSTSCADCSMVTRCQLCYECFDCRNCYNLAFSEHCRTTSDSAFCYDCIGCKNCIGCIGLRNCEYHVFNKKLDRQEYEKFLAENSLTSRKNIDGLKSKFEAALLKHPHRAAIIQNCENCTGDYIVESKNIRSCFDVEKTDTAAYSIGCEFSKDIVDSNFIYYGENCYENMSNTSGTNILFTGVAIESVFDLLYCYSCMNGANNCFGSVSLKKNKYCILNRQYPKHEYESLMTKILEHMKHTGEYGEFFPITLSPFAYNESLAFEFYPVSKEQVLARGWRWREEEEKPFAGQKHEMPDSLGDTPDSITDKLINCESCGKGYKIFRQELEQHRKMGIALAGACPDCRNRARTALHKPRKLWERKCAKCGAEIQTTYAPDRPETIYCEKCYLEAVY